MRNELCNSLIEQASNPSMIFLTGDLGFMALEPLQEKLGERFLNAGVAEQNMMSVGAALAKDGWQPWCYSIAPFCFARPFEQIRNDICLHDLPVKLLSNGGGYGYGVMGPTHHAVEDYGVMLALPNMKVFVPCFNEDVAPTTLAASLWNHPSYVRLGRGELPVGEVAPKYEPWRQVTRGSGAVVVAVGPLGGVAWSTLRDLSDAERPDLWILSELPILDTLIPQEILSRLNAGARLVVIEEHVTHGSAGALLVYALTNLGVSVRGFKHLAAKSLSVGAYGSQQFLRARSGLSPEHIKSAVVSSGAGK